MLGSQGGIQFYRRLSSVTYDVGNGFGRLAFGVDDIYKKACGDLRSRGSSVIREPGPTAHGTTRIAFTEDPNGCKVES